MPASCPRALVAALLLAIPFPAFAQGLDLTVNHVGVAIGDVPRVTGLRINYRDRNLEWVNGVNVTIWSPYGEGSGTVRGLALGLPVTGAGRIDGVATGIFGVGAGDRIRGLGVGPLGIGAGGRLEGIMVGGLGVGSGGGMTGFGVGGLGVGSGGPLRGAFVGGLGVGGGGSVEGIAIGGLGVGAGGDVTGLAIGGLGVGAGGTLRGVAIGGLGVGAPRVHGIAIALLGVGAQEGRGAMIAPWVKIERGEMQGLTVGAFNQVKGLHHGLAIGVVNYAEELQGVQIGLINIARNNPSGAKVLPIANAHF
jgi:hypothetical protein